MLVTVVGKIHRLSLMRSLISFLQPRNLASLRAVCILLVHCNDGAIVAQTLPAWAATWTRSCGVWMPCSCPPSTLLRKHLLPSATFRFSKDTAEDLLQI